MGLTNVVMFQGSGERSIAKSGIPHVLTISFGIAGIGLGQRRATGGKHLSVSSRGCLGQSDGAECRSILPHPGLQHAWTFWHALVVVCKGGGSWRPLRTHTDRTTACRRARKDRAASHAHPSHATRVAPGKQRHHHLLGHRQAEQALMLSSATNLCHVLAAFVGHTIAPLRK